MFDFELNHHPS